VVCYSNRAKTELADVPDALIVAHGAVSEPVARAMAEGIRRRSGTNIGIGVTGIAGPGGGTAREAGGNRGLAVPSPTRCRSAHIPVHRGRDMLKFQSAQSALNMTP